MLTLLLLILINYETIASTQNAIAANITSLTNIIIVCRSNYFRVLFSENYRAINNFTNQNYADETE